MALRTVPAASLGCLLLTACLISAAHHLSLGCCRAAATPHCSASNACRSPCLSPQILLRSISGYGPRLTEVVMQRKKERVSSRCLLVNRAQGHLAVCCTSHPAPQTGSVYTQMSAGIYSSLVYLIASLAWLPYACPQEPALLLLRRLCAWSHFVIGMLRTLFTGSTGPVPGRVCTPCASRTPLWVHGRANSRSGERSASCWSQATGCLATGVASGFGKITAALHSPCHQET